MTSKEKENLALMNLSTSTINSSMDSTTNNFGKLFTQLEVSTPRPFPSKDSANTFKRNLQAESSPSDDQLFCIFMTCLFLLHFDLKSAVTKIEID